VRLIEHDLAEGALLLEWLDAERSLGDVPIAAAIPIAGELTRRMAVPAGAGVPTLAEQAEEWGNGGFARRSAECGEVLPEAVCNRAETVCAELGPTAANLMVSGDLHYENVLPGPNGNWLAIDPKPVAGDPEFALAPLLWRRFDEDRLPNRLRLLVESGGLDAERAQGWTLVHTIHYWLWAVSVGLTEDPKVCASIVRWLMQRA
jgi:streptomycin 6-kinase